MGAPSGQSWDAWLAVGRAAFGRFRVDRGRPSRRRIVFDSPRRLSALQRAEIGDQRVDLLLGDLLAKGRHDVFPPGSDFGSGIENRLANVGIVGDERAPVVEPHGIAVQPFQDGSAGPRIGAVTADAAVLEENLATLESQRTL